MPSLSGRLSSVEHRATIRMQSLPTEHTRVRTREEHETRSNLTRLSRSAQRCREPFLRILVHRGRNERCPDRSWADGVDSDAFVDLLICQPARKCDDCALGGGIVEEIGPADVGVYRGVVDDGVAALHVWDDEFGEVKVRVDVSVEGLVPLFE